MIRRRQLITLLGGVAAAWPIVVRAQQSDQARRIGVLIASQPNDGEAQERLGIFRQSLERLGWTEGRNVRIEYRWAGDDLSRMRVDAAELVNMAPDAILATNGPTLEALRDKTRSIPLVFVAIPDAVAGGYVSSLAHPGGNITGFSHFEYAMGGKWLEILREIAPSVAKIVVAWNPRNISVNGYFPQIEAAAPALAVDVTAGHVENAGDIERVIVSLAHEPNGGLIIPPDFTTIVHRDLIIGLTTRYHLPTIFPFPIFVKDGGLISYGINLPESYRQAATYMDRILRGEKPVDLPVQAPTKFQLAINLKAAKAFGLEVPPTLLARADEVIE
jgi:putative ABC transport system substrate-binding protein